MNETVMILVKRLKPINIHTLQFPLDKEVKMEYEEIMMTQEDYDSLIKENTKGV